MATHRIAGLILAAGESSRMGRDKALLDHRGRTFLESIISTLRAAGMDEIVVVLGHHAEEILRAVNLDGVRAVSNPDFRRGQTSSLQAGLRAFEPAPPEAVVLCLVDHPALSPEVIRSLVASFCASGAPVVIPTHGGVRGHPVVIGRALFRELLGLDVSQGANVVMRKHRQATQWVGVSDPGVLVDVDDPETYERLLAAAMAVPMSRDEEYMRSAIRKAKEGIAAGQSPFGAVVVRDGGVVALAHNTVWRDNDPTAHAEVNAIREAAKALGTIDLAGCTIYSTCEPCPMCLAAIHWAKVGDLYYGATIEDAAAAGFSELRVDAATLARMGGSPLRIQGGLLNAECRELFDFWKRSNLGKTY